jgi:hypothetical protein
MTQAVRKFAARLIDSPQYQRSIIERAKAGTLAPSVERMLWRIGHPVIVLPRRREPAQRKDAQ